MQGFSLATDIAEWLVRQGMPFRDAHEAAGCVRADRRGARRRTARPDHAELLSVSPMLTEDVRERLDVLGSLASRNGTAGTAPKQVLAQVESLLSEIARLRAS